MKQLFVTDLDGTLLNRDSRVSPESARIISRLSREGALITCATARTPATVELLLRDTLTLPPGIVMTGAAMWDRSTGQYIDPHFIPEPAAADIVARCAAHAIAPFIYTIGADGIIHTYFHGTPTNKEQKFIDERSHLRLKRIHIVSRPRMAVSPVYPSTILIFALGDLNAIERLADELMATGACSVSSYPDIFNHSLGYIEIFAPGVSKAAAVERLKTSVGADCLIVFGDNLNDIPMMSVADLAVAVDNALPRVKDAADIVIGPNTADSVARFIQTRFQ